MRIAVVGPGSLGSVYAALLSHGGHEVTFIGRAESIDILRHRGVVIHGLEDLHVNEAVTDDPTMVGPVDLLLLCTKAIDTKATLSSLHGMQVDASPTMVASPRTWSRPK